MKRHVRKGDTVQVLSGSAKGQTGTVLKVLTSDNPNHERVLVQGVNVRPKRVRATESNPQGGEINAEVSIHISNVSPVDANGKPTRIRYETRDDGSKVRLAATTGDVLGPELKKSRS